MKHISSAVWLLSLPLLVISCNNPAPNSATTTIHAPTPSEEANITNQPSPFPTQTLPKTDPTAMDRADQTIYASFMHDTEGAIKVIREDTFVDTYPRTEEETTQFIASNVPGVSSETLENYIYVNATSSELPANMNLGVKYILISTPEFLEITGSPDWRNVWRQRFPNSEVSCIAFSRIGFNRSRTQALLYVARLWIEGGYYLLEHNAQKGIWEIVEQFANVITD